MSKKKAVALQVLLALISLGVICGYGFAYIKFPILSKMPYNILGLVLIAAVFSVFGTIVRMKIDKTAKYYTLTMYIGLISILVFGIGRAILISLM
jgi:hypothetical protein